jgi:hypothetical protein
MPTAVAPWDTGLVSMSVDGATVISGSPSPRPGGRMTVLGVSRGERVRVNLVLATGDTSRRVLVGAELRCLDQDGELVVVPQETRITIPATEAGRPDSERVWQSRWLMVPEECRAGAAPTRGDGDITGWAQSGDDDTRAEVVARIELR